MSNNDMLSAMAEMDKIIKNANKSKKKKNNTPKQVSYLVRFNTTEEDFPKEREDTFKAQLSAFMRDTAPMDMPEILPYERKPISLEKEKKETENDNIRYKEILVHVPKPTTMSVIALKNMGELPYRGSSGCIYVITENEGASEWVWYEEERSYYIANGKTNIDTKTKGVIRPYEISDYKAKAENEKVRKSQSTQAEKAYIDVMSAKEAHLYELYADWCDDNITAIKYVENSIRTLMNSTDPTMVNSNGDIMAGHLSYNLSPDYEFKVTTKKPLIDIQTSKSSYCVKIELLPTNIFTKIFAPWKKRNWEIKIILANVDREYPIHAVHLVNFPYRWKWVGFRSELENDGPVIESNILNSFVTLMVKASHTQNLHQEYTFWDHLMDLI